MGSAKQTETIVRTGQEGSRWWNERPSSDQVAEWFKTVPLHDDMDHERYINGIVLIEQKIKTKEVVGFNEGRPQVRDGIENLTYTPYPKVETRVQYFHDLMGAHEDWLGIIEPIGGGEEGLPPGFFYRVTIQGPNAGTRYICCTMRCVVYERANFEEKVIESRHGGYEIVRTGKTIIHGAPATKMVPVLAYNRPDDHSLMKAETGAVGRALGMAGMLIVPGAGVATADDMREHEQEIHSRGQQADPEGATLEEPKQAAQPPQVDEKADLEARVVQLLKELEPFPEQRKLYVEWSEERGVKSMADLNKIDTSAVKGLVRKGEKVLDECQRGG